MSLDHSRQCYVEYRMSHMVLCSVLKWIQFDQAAALPMYFMTNRHALLSTPYCFIGAAKGGTIFKLLLQTSKANLFWEDLSYMAEAMCVKQRMWPKISICLKFKPCLNWTWPNGSPPSHAFVCLMTCSKRIWLSISVQALSFAPTKLTNTPTYKCTFFQSKSSKSLAISMYVNSGSQLLHIL